MLEAIQDSPILQTAARIAAKFGLDPVAVAEETDQFKRLFRQAAYEQIQEDEKKSSQQV